MLTLSSDLGQGHHSQLSTLGCRQGTEGQADLLVTQVAVNKLFVLPPDVLCALPGRVQLPRTEGKSFLTLEQPEGQPTCPRPLCHNASPPGRALCGPGMAHATSHVSGPMLQAYDLMMTKPPADRGPGLGSRLSDSCSPIPRASGTWGAMCPLAPVRFSHSTATRTPTVQPQTADLTPTHIPPTILS